MCTRANVKERKSKMSSAFNKIAIISAWFMLYLELGWVISVAYLSQNSSFRSVKVEEKSSKEIVILHQLFPRDRSSITTCSPAGQGNIFHPVPRYPVSARSNVVQAFIIARRYVVNGLRGASTGFVGRIRIIWALQIHVSDTTVAAEDIRHTLHDTGLSTACEINLDL